MATDCTQDSRFSAVQRKSLRRRLLSWYRSNARQLPWRENSDPYRVWVSEVMLQQTQVETVRGYFERFVEAFPTVADLASAEEGQVLRLWEGLGYYRRARQLHAAAQQVVDEYGGQFPRDVQALQELPGIGRYTAGAIASIAYDQRAPILEANTIRLLSRLIGYEADPSRSEGQKLLWSVAEEVLPRKEVAQFNQALMELGSLVCTPTDPRCGHCPLGQLCVAQIEGKQEEIPVVCKTKSYTDLREAAVVVRDSQRVLLRQCGDDERWAGLWDFPRFELEAEGPLFAHEELVTKVRDLTGVTCRPGPLLKTIKHGVTRYRITLDCYDAEFVSGRVRGAEWVHRRDLDDYPLSTTGRKIARHIQLASTTERPPAV